MGSETGERLMEYPEDVRYLLWLVMVFGAGNPKIREAIRHNNTPKGAYMALHAPDAKQQVKLTEKNWRRIAQVQDEQVEEMLERCNKLGISILWYGDPAYPEQLNAVVNAPVLLFYQGDVSLLQDHLLLTIVGTRTPTEYSLRVEKQICGELVQENFIPITGFAVGIDITANLCALDADRPSIALMGCGLDVVYPKAHNSLKKKMIEKGLVLSEFPPGTPPIAQNFPLRNRVLAGLSMGTMVIQAPLRSGALITAECALEQGRDVFCVPPANIFDNRYLGVVKYLRDGAIPVFDSRDIIYAYYTSHAHLIDPSALYFEKPKMSESLVMSLGKPESLSEADTPAEKPKSKKSKPKPASPEWEDPPNPERPQDLFPEDTDEERAIMELMRKNQVMHLDLIAAETNFTMEQLVVTLTDLELCGKIERIPGKQFRLL